MTKVNTNTKFKTINNNINKNLSKQESKEIKSFMNQDNSISNDINASYSNIYYTIDDDFFNDISIRKDYKIKELIKKNKQLKNEIENKNDIIESLEKQIEILKEKKGIDVNINNDNNENNNCNKNDKDNNINSNITLQNKIDEINFELGKLTREVEEKNEK